MGLGRGTSGSGGTVEMREKSQPTKRQTMRSRGRRRARKRGRGRDVLVSKKPKKIVLRSIKYLFRDDNWTTPVESYRHDITTFSKSIAGCEGGI